MRMIFFSVLGFEQWKEIEGKYTDSVQIQKCNVLYCTAD